MKKEYSIRCNFLKNELISNEVIKLVANDVNSTTFNFEFNEELSDKKVLFKLKKPNESFWIKEIINNQVELVDFDEDGNPLIVITSPGIYSFEISVYDESSKLTNYALSEDFNVREELINQGDIDNYVSSSEKIPVLDQLINQNIAISNEEKIRETAESNRDNNEKERISNEDIRKTNETIRRENEISREKYINDLKQDVSAGKFNGKDGEDYVLTEQDEDNIADKVKIKLETTLEANLKASKDYTDNANMFDIKNVEFNSNNGSFTFTRHDDTKIIIDLPVELITKDGYYDSNTQELVLILMNNQEIRIPVSGLIDDYSTEDSTTIQLSISADNVITASIKGQSISKTHLTQELQDEINNKVNNDNYASSDKSGVIKVPDWSGLVMNSSGNLYPDVYTLERYKQRGINLALSKGTMENIKNAYVKEAVQSDEVKEELRNQGFVKDDDLKPLKKNIDDDTDRIKRLEYDIFDSGEAEGTSIHIEDSTFAEAIEIGNEGVSNQETTKGNQLIDFFNPEILDNHVSFSYEGEKITLTGDGESGYQRCHYEFPKEFIKPNSKISFSCEDSSISNESSNGCVQLRIEHLLDTSSSFIVLYNIISKERTSYTLPKNCDDISRIIVQVITDNRPVEKVESNEISITKPILYIGDLDNLPGYEKYTGTEASPSLDYPQDIEVIESGNYNIYTCGKNMFDYINPNLINQNGINVIRNDDGSFTFTGKPIKNYIRYIVAKDYTDLLIDGESYTISQNIPGYIYLQITATPINQSDAFIYYTSSNSPTRNHMTFVTDKSKYTYTMYFINGLVENFTDEINITLFFQLEKGNKATEFEPYIESKVEVTIPEGEFVSEGDRINVEWNEEDREYHKYLYKNVGRYTYKITNVNSNGVDYNNKKLNVISPVNENIKTDVLTFDTTLKSSHFFSLGTTPSKRVRLEVPFTFLDVSEEESDTISATELLSRLRNKYGSLDDTIYFPLAEPYKIDLGIADMSKTFTEITNVSSDHPLQPNLHIKYYRDFKKTIKELQNKVQILETDTIKNTDFATYEKGGIVKLSSDVATGISKNGSLIAGVKTLEQYNSLSDYAFISKGTLEAVLQPIRDKLEQLSPSINQESEVNNDDLLQE